MYLVRTRLRNVPALREETAHVAAGRGHAEHARARQKMIQRLFFDGVNLQRGRCPISKVIECSVLIGANEAESRLAWMDMAMARTKIAVNSPVCFRLPPAGFV